MKNLKITGIVLMMAAGTLLQSCKKSAGEVDYPREYDGEVVDEHNMPDSTLGNKPEQAAPETDSSDIGSPAGTDNM